jgi:hypothetical protein
MPKIFRLILSYCLFSKLYTPVNPKENIVIGLIGLNAPKSTDFLTYGQETNQQALNNARITGSQFSNPENEEQLVFLISDHEKEQLATLLKCEKQIGHICLENIQNAVALDKSLSQKNQTIIQRFISIQNLKDYQEDGIASVYSRHFADQLWLSKYMHFHALRNVLNKQESTGFNQLKQLNRLYRAQLNGNMSAIGFLMMSATLLDMYHSIDWLLFNRPHAWLVAHQDQLQELTQVLSSQEKRTLQRLAIIEMEFFAYATVQANHELTSLNPHGTLLLSPISNKSKITINQQWRKLATFYAHLDFNQHDNSSCSNQPSQKKSIAIITKNDDTMNTFQSSFKRFNEINTLNCQLHYRIKSLTP